MTDVLQRFVEAEGNSYVVNLLIGALRLGDIQTFNLNLFDVQVDCAAGTVVIEDILCPGEIACLSTGDFQRLLLSVHGTLED
jgi:hypothetical protein